MIRLGDHRLTLALLGIVVVLFIIMGRFFPAELAIPLPGSSIRPVLLFEFASTPQHLTHIFGEPGDPQRTARIAGMSTGNAIDYLLMPAYGLLTLSFFAGLSQEAGPALFRWFGWMGIAAGMADAVENQLLFSITRNLADPAREMVLLPFPVWVKFGLLAASCAGAAWGFARLQRWGLAALSLPAPMLILPAWLAPYTIGPIATLTIGLGWLAMGIHAGSRLLQKRQH